MKKILEFFVGADLWKSRFGVVAAAAFASLIWFVLDWCMATSFRSFTYWLLYPINLTAAFLLALPYVATRKGWAEWLLLLVVDFVLLSKIWYARTYLTAIPPESYLLVANLGDFTGSVADSLRIQDIGFVVILVAGYIIYKRIPAAVPPRIWGRYGALTGLCLLVSTVGLLARGGFYRDVNRLAEDAYTTSCPPAVHTVAGWIIYNLLEARNNSATDMTAEIDRWIENHSRLNPYRPLPEAVAPRRSLVMIVCESLESWPIGLRLNGREVTPNLDRWLRDSTTFYAPRLLTQVAQGRSIEFQLLATTGLLPMKGTVYSNRFADARYPSLNKAMKETYGAESYIFTCDQPFTWNQLNISRSFGYDDLYPRDSLVIDEWIGHRGKPSDGTFLRQNVDRLRRTGLWPEGESRMLTFLTYSGHNPFLLPEKFRDPDFDISGLGLPEVVENYILMTHYVDSQLPTLVDYLRSRPDYGQTLIVITGDHEGLAGYREPALRESAEAAKIVEREQFTPFIVLNSPVAGRVDSVVAQVDIYTTLLKLLGLDDYPWKGMGRSITDAAAPFVAVSSMTGRWVGDTTSLGPARRLDLSRARSISDAIIRQDYFRPTTEKQPLITLTETR